jgi:hypothetical protein
MVFHVFEKCFQIIVGGGYIRDTIAGEEAPPAMAHGLHDAGDDVGVLRLLSGGLFQLFQKLLDLPFDLTGLSPMSLFVARFK